jgi:hypothetical protein
MGKRYLIDTNILIAFQENILPSAGQQFVAAAIDNEFNISIVNKIEILGYSKVTNETKKFISLATVFELDNDIADTTIKIRQSRKIKLPDAIIAATAQVYKLTIITNNTRDFSNLKGVKIIDPFAL